MAVVKKIIKLNTRTVYFLAIIASFGILFSAYISIQLNRSQSLSDLRLSVTANLSQIRSRLEGNIHSNAKLVQGLAAAISTEPNMTQERFSKLSSYLFRGQHQLRNIGGAPDLVISLMYPIKGNEKAIGLDYRKNAKQRDAALLARDINKLILAGPLTLVQGGQGLIGRVPVFYVDEKNRTEKFWGLISTVIDVEKLYRDSGLLDDRRPIEIAIKGKNGAGAEGEQFFGRPEVFTASPVLATVSLPHGSWQLAAIPKGGWPLRPDNEIALILLFFVGGVLIVGPLVLVGRLLKERQAIFERLNEAKEAAEKANTAKSEFLASMSHELRTPLNAVLGFAQMMQFDPKNPLSPVQNEHVENILEGGEHLLELINEVLDLARIEADQLDLSLEKVNANDVVADCVALTSPLGEARGIKIIDQFSGRPSALLRTDQLRLKQVLLNLLSNAVKYNKDGGMVTVEGHETENGFLRLSVTDTGIGIAEVDYSSIFQMFHRIGADPMVAREGTGIGLTVTKLLVEQMAGRIGCESEPDVGSTFWFELPLASNEEVIIWTDSLRVGVDAIDKDHQVIVSLLNRVTHRCIEDAELDTMIEELIDYTRHHFRREEAIMEICGYPDLEKHRDHHRELTVQVNDLADTWRKEHNPETLRHLRKFLRAWWIGHIVKVDTEIAQHGKGKEQEIRQALESLG